MAGKKKEKKETNQAKEVKPKNAGLKKLRALVSNLPGKYLLPYNKGQEFEIEAKQAEEMIKAKDAEEV
ncbi:MAG TPA: hypothetical protein VFM70_02650 [Salinimicrobium sp.]|nr:hypothetical protein [Salinimicrobium sp.]